MTARPDIVNELTKRISDAREAAGFTLSEAATALGFNNYQTLSSIEKGERKVTASELNEMAKLYSRNFDYFFSNEDSTEPEPLWRKTSDESLAKTKRTFISFLENYNNLEKLSNLKRKWNSLQKNYRRDDFINSGYRTANNIAIETHSTLNLGSRPASNLSNVLENDIRIKILHFKLVNNISGASIVDDNLGAGILINKEDAPWRRNFDLAHELFHIITWNVFPRDEIGDGTQKTLPEKFANIFASALLLPEKEIRNSFDDISFNNKVRIVDIIELAKEFFVSTAAILWRLVNLNLIAKESANNILNDNNFKELDKSMRHSEYNEPDTFPEKFISLACRCLIEGKISRGTFSNYLNIGRHEVDDFMEEHGYTVTNYEEIVATRC
jgi:Zn-dependent peptidase ImmA (M78 family)/DNA-binding XRE family transcriptional regulator